jgi:hypothetical protein
MTDIRILLSDKAIAQLPPKDGWYLARDTELKGSFIFVGKRKRTFTVQCDPRLEKKRASSIRVSIGDTREPTTRAARAIAGQADEPSANSDRSLSFSVANEKEPRRAA